MGRLQWITFPAILLILLFSCISIPVRAADVELPDETTWPREITIPEGKILIYQPQLEKFEGNKMESRFAASIQTPKMAEPVFGAVWTKARMETDRDTRMVRLVSLETVQSRFPNATPEQEEAFAELLKKQVPQWNISISLDRLLAGLEVVEQHRILEAELEDKPPKIIHVEHPAVLVMLDGQPILQPIDNSALMAVVNTPFPMVFHKTEKAYYLMGNETWYRAKEVTGTWEEVSSPPEEVAKIRPESPDTGKMPDIAANLEIIGATEPTELISTDGTPRLTPFPGNDLMFVENTDSDILYEVDTGRYFLILSGRWYHAKKLTGPWSPILPTQLPKSFATIPPDSEKGNLRASIPGTIEAREAVLDAQVPETAAIKRSEATLEVTYDGEPKFEPITGTALDYAVNTATPVIQVEGKYYAVDNGVWFTSAKPKGPWTVSDTVPDSVQDIPPSSPVYNIRFVYVYDTTPDVVYVGYTPGYTGCYVHHGVVVYGTGYYYHPWHNHYYYPRPVTWGYSVRYSFYSGWSFGIAISDGPFTFYFGHSWGYPYYHGWWGPPMYRPPYYRPPYYRPPAHRPPGNRPPGNRPPGSKPPGNRPPVAKPPIAKPPGDHPPVADGSWKGRPAQLPSDGSLYDRLPGREIGDKTRPASGPGKDTRPAGRPAALPNNIYTDRDGDVYRRTDRGWEQRQGNKWTSPGGNNDFGTVTGPDRKPQFPSRTPSEPAVQPAPRPAATPVQQPSRQPSGSSWETQQRYLQREANSRNRGQERTQQFQQFRQVQPGRGSAGRIGGQMRR